jgi:hypothetical protein
VEGYNPPPGQELQVDQRTASIDYFRAMQISLVAGRFFSENDRPETSQVVIIDENFAKRFWPHNDAIGKHLWFDPKKPITIVGVVGAVKQYGLDTDGKIATYFPLQQGLDRGMFLVARANSHEAGLSTAIVSEIHAVDPTVVVYGIRTMEDRLHDSLARQRFSSTMLGAFAAFALLLAAVGLYGVLSYLVTQSTRDIGILLALGAQRQNILSLVVRQGMQLTLIGIIAGLLGAIALTRVIASRLFGVTVSSSGARCHGHPSLAGRQGRSHGSSARGLTNSPGLKKPPAELAIRIVPGTTITSAAVQPVDLDPFNDDRKNCLASLRSLEEKPPGTRIQLISRYCPGENCAWRLLMSSVSASLSRPRDGKCGTVRSAGPFGSR